MRENKRRGAAILRGVIVACIVFICMGWVIKAMMPRRPAAQNPYLPEQADSAVLPSYEVLDEEVYEVPGKAQVILKILVWGEISESGLRTLLHSGYLSVKRRTGFKYHDSPTVIAIYAFTSQEKADSMQWLAMLTKSPRNAPIISVSKDRLSLYQSPSKPTEKFGLSETNRKEIFQESVKVEDKAMMEAEKKYPVNGGAYPVGEFPSDSEFREIAKKNAELMKKLMEEYKNDITASYGITREELEKICLEAMLEDWPMPKWKGQ